MPSFVSIRDASKQTSYSVDYIRRLVREGIVAGRKVVTIWQVDLDDLRRYQLEQEAKKQER